MPLYTTDNDETYITTGNVAWNASDSQEAKLKKIITQKWIALYPDGFEAWSEFRPVFVIGTPKFQDWVAISIKS